MKEWLSAAELAAEALPQMPATKAGVLQYAEREGWAESLAYARKRAGRGGGLEFHIALLPTSARLAYETRHRRVVTLPVPARAPAVTVTVPAPVSDRAARERDARLAILSAYDSFCRGTGLGAASSALIFSDKYNARTVAIEPWIVETVARISPRTLARWRAEAKAGRANKLAVDRAHRKGKGLLDLAEDGAVRVFVLALLASQPHLAATQIQVQIRHRFGDGLKVLRGGVTSYEPVPPVRTIQAYVAGLRETERVALMRANNPDRYRSTMVPAGTDSYADVTQLGTLWMIDASPVDALCVDGRWSIYACVDVGTRSLTLYVSRTPRAAAVQLLARKAILAWGRADQDQARQRVGLRGRGYEAPVRLSRHRDRAFAALPAADEGLRGAGDPHLPTRLRGASARLHRPQRFRAEGDRGPQELRGAPRRRYGGDLRSGANRRAAGGARRPLGRDDLRPPPSQRPQRPDAGTGARALDTADRDRGRSCPRPPADAGRRGWRHPDRDQVRPPDRRAPIRAAGAAAGRTGTPAHGPARRGAALAFAVEDGRYVGEATCAELSGIDPRAIIRARKEAQEAAIAGRMAGVAAEIKALTQGPSLIERALEVAARDVPNLVTFPAHRVAASTAEIEAAIAAMEGGAPRITAAADPAIAAEQARIQAMLDRMDAGLPPSRST